MKRRLLLVATFCVCALGASWSATAQDVTLRFWTNWGGGAFDALRSALDQFEAANPGIKVKLETGVDTDKVIAAIAGGEAPNAFVTAGGYATLANQGYLQPLDPYLSMSSSINASKYPADVWNSLKIGGKIYGLPALEAGPIFGLRWNLAHFAAAGLTGYTQDVAPTYTQVLADAKKLTLTDADGRITRLGYLPWGGVQSEPEWWTLGFNVAVGYSQPIASGKIKLANPVLADGLDLIARDVYRALGPQAVSDFIAKSAVPYSTGMFQGYASIAGDGYWSSGRGVKESPGNAFGTTWMPNVSGLKKQLVGGFRVVVPVGAQNLPETVKLALYIAGPEVTEAMFVGAGFATSNLDFIKNTDLAKYPGLDLYLRKLGEADYIAKPTTIPDAGKVWDAFNAAVTQIFAGKTTAIAALENADRQLSDVQGLSPSS